MRIFIATDAWTPQVNGVVQTYQRLAEQFVHFDVDVEFLTPQGLHTLPLPTYSEIRFALIKPSYARRRLEGFNPDYVHIATEGSIGLTVRNICRKIGKPFTTSYHTKFPEYLASRFPVPHSLGYAYERWFHNSGVGMMVVTKSLSDDLAERGFNNIYQWSRGVNLALFRPRSVRLFGSEQPVFLYVGRVAVEKNVEAFLKLNLPGKKVVVGSGPQLEELIKCYPTVTFAGAKFGEELAEHYASADVLVFPSLTDTFGNVMLEALASGVPVAAFPVTGPKDLILNSEVGVLSKNLADAAKAALKIDRQKCRSYAATYSWKKCSSQFIDNIVTANAKVKSKKDTT